MGQLNNSTWIDLTSSSIEWGWVTYETIVGRHSSSSVQPSWKPTVEHVQRRYIHTFSMLYEDAWARQQKRVWQNCSPSVKKCNRDKLLSNKRLQRPDLSLGILKRPKQVLRAISESQAIRSGGFVEDNAANASAGLSASWMAIINHTTWPYSLVAKKALNIAVFLWAQARHVV